MPATLYFFDLEREIVVPVAQCISQPVLVTKTYKSPGEAKQFTTSLEVPVQTPPAPASPFTPQALSPPARLRIPGVMSSLTVAVSAQNTAPQSAQLTLTPSLSANSDDTQLTQAPRQFDQLANFWEVQITPDGSIDRVHVPYPQLKSWSTQPPSFAADLYP